MSHLRYSPRQIKYKNLTAKHAKNAKVNSNVLLHFLLGVLGVLGG
jgi:hypothetical protein